MVLSRCSTASLCQFPSPSHAPFSILSFIRLLSCERMQGLFINLATQTCARKWATVWSGYYDHSYQMAIAGYLDRMRLALLDYGSTTLRCKMWSFPFLGLHPYALHPSAIQGKGGIKFCYLATPNMTILLQMFYWTKLYALVALNFDTLGS